MKRKWTPFKSLSDQIAEIRAAGEPLPDESWADLVQRELDLEVAARFRAIMAVPVDRNAK